MVGRRCVWIKGYPHNDHNVPLQNRIYDILSVTLTHVYIKNVRSGLGDSRNVPIREFDSNYVLHAKMEEE